MHTNPCDVEGSRDGSIGLVFRKTRGRYAVQTGDRTVVCSLSNLLRKELVYPIADPSSFRRRVMSVDEIDVLDPVAVGDQVRFVDAGDDTGVIHEVLPRRTKLSRPGVGGRSVEQVLVANLDLVLPIIAAAEPPPTWALLDRHLVTAEGAGVPAIICITKTDLADERTLRRDLRVYEEIGYGVVRTSAPTGRGMEALREVLQGRLSVMIGKSGVGKTTLLNALQPGLGLRVRDISASTGKGRHTTSHLEMFPLDGGGGLVDTPGMRAFGLWDVDKARLAERFPEMRPYLGQCRFGSDCSHLHEPGCAIKDALAGGRIARRRYASYTKLRR
jgi:ribosome biogenesis GTPase